MKILASIVLTVFSASTLLHAEVDRPQIKSTEGDVLAHMKAITLPLVTFSPPATIIDVVEFFKVASRNYDDQSLPLERRGVNLMLKLDTAEPPAIPAVSLRNVSLEEALRVVLGLVNYKFTVNGSVVDITPKSFYDPNEWPNREFLAYAGISGEPEVLSIGQVDEIIMKALADNDSAKIQKMRGFLEVLGPVLSGNPQAEDLTKALDNVVNGALMVQKDEPGVKFGDPQIVSVLLSVGRKAKSSAVGAAAVARAEQIVKTAFSAASKYQSHEEVMETCEPLLVGCEVGYGFDPDCRIPESCRGYLVSMSLIKWEAGQDGVKPFGKKDAAAALVLARTSADVMRLANGLVSAKTSSQAQAKLAVLDKAVKAREKALLVPVQGVKPSKFEAMYYTAMIHFAYANLLSAVKAGNPGSALKKALGTRLGTLKNSCRSELKTVLKNSDEQDGYTRECEVALEKLKEL